MISLSLQSSARRRPFQRSLVRTSTSCYGGFTLSKDSSHGLRVHRDELGSPCSDSLSLRLPFRLASLATVTRGLIMQKANGRVPKHAPIACGRTISGLFHSASSGSFRLSLAVLVRYRSPGSIQPWRVVPPASGGVPRAPPYSGSRPGWAEDFGYGALTPCGPAFQPVLLTVPVPFPGPATPGSTLPGLGSCAFARRYSRNVV